MTAVASSPSSVTSDLPFIKRSDGIASEKSSPPPTETASATMNEETSATDEPAPPPPYVSPEVEEKLAKLKRLLATSTAFSSIIAERIKAQKLQRAAAVKNAEEAAAAKNANGKRGKHPTNTTSPTKRAKVKVDGAQGSEGIKEEADESKRAKNEEILYMKQPESVTGATLRDYQLAGVQWLTLLYENGESHGFVVFGRV